jgi:extensin-like protein
MRGVRLYLFVPLVLLVSLALSSCRVFDYEQREPWRAEAEEKCIAEKTVQPSAYMEPESELDGQGTCGMVHPFKVTAMDGGRIEVTPKATLACPIIGEVDRWLSGPVQTAAQTWFGEPIVEIKQISAYSCRTMNGQPGTHISEHAFGNALDVASFRLASGREIVIKNAWKSGAYEDRGFLRDIISDACERFNTVLGPGSNVFHYDHFHVDLSRRASGKTYCNPEVARMTPPNRAYARAPQRTPQVTQNQTYAQPASARNSYPQRGYNDLPLGNRPQEYDQPQYGQQMQQSRNYPQAAAQPVELHPQPSYPQNTMQAPAYAPQPQPYYPPSAPDPYRPLPPKNVGAKFGNKEEIMTGSIGKKEKLKSGHEKALARKPAPQAAKPMANGDLFSPVPMASQKVAPRKMPIEEATLKALKAN